MGKKIADMKVRITFTAEVLGTLAGDPEVATTHILNQNPNGLSDDEVAALPAEEQLDKVSTLFPRVDGQPVLWDYQVKGFFKAACGALNRAAGKGGDGYLPAYKQVIDTCIFVYPRAIPLILPEGEEMGLCERPLRASTAQGERIALARSETVPIGTTAEFEVRPLDSTGKWDRHIEHWLAYGEMYGFLQWRNSGKGRFTHEIIA